LIKDHFELLTIRDYSHLTGKNFTRAVNLAWKTYTTSRIGSRPAGENHSELDTKYSDEGFEDTILQTLPEFHNLFQDDLYFIPPHYTDQGDKTDYPDVIGVLKDGSIGIINAKYWAWRPGDVLRTHSKMKAEMNWYKILSREHPDQFKVLLFAKHKETGQVFIFEVPLEKAIYGSYPVRLPPPSSSPSNLPSPSGNSGKEEEAAP
jgi:hypothetical protein